MPASGAFVCNFAGISTPSLFSKLDGMALELVSRADLPYTDTVKLFRAACSGVFGTTSCISILRYGTRVGLRS